MARRVIQKPLITRVLDSVPGKQTLGIYRFIPLFFALGAALEFSMINWTVGETNFYRTFKKRQAENIVTAKVTAIFYLLPVTANFYLLPVTAIFYLAMPAGVSWPTYLKFGVAAFLSMFAGSQAVHVYYRPLEDLEKIVQELEAQRKAEAEIKLEAFPNKATTTPNKE